MLIPFAELIRKYNINPKGVCHIGSSWGQEAESYYSNGVKQTIWIEAIPEVFEKLWENVQKYPNVQVFNACIDESFREVEFNISSNGGESSSIYEFGEHEKMHPDVKFIDKIKLKTTRLDAIEMNLDKFEYPFDFINLDIQGNELSALKSLGILINRFNYVYLEVNKIETYIGCPLFDEVSQWMIENGFELKEVVWVKNQKGQEVWGDAFFIRKTV